MYYPVGVPKFMSSRCSRLLLVTFDIAAIVCDGSNTTEEEKEKGSGGERRILVFCDDKWVPALNSHYCPHEQFITLK